MHRFVLLLLLSTPLFAQSPLATQEITGQTDLGVLLRWQPVAGATYNVYRSNGSYGCPKNAVFELIARGLSTTTYIDQGQPLNFYCYGVTSVVGGIESPKAEADVALGEKPYFILSYRTLDCKTPLPGSLAFGTHFVLTELRNGVSTVILDAVAGSSHNSRSLIRLYDDAQYSLVATLPDGKVMNFPAPVFGTGQPLSAIESNNNQLYLTYPGDHWCSYVVQSTLQPATSNP